jgi:hypothetical protein
MELGGARDLAATCCFYRVENWQEERMRDSSGRIAAVPER